jgi:hypothetical protein
MKTSELTNAALDWAVTKCEGYDHEVTAGDAWGMWGWATDWAQGGKIIEREMIEISAHEPDDIEWVARSYWGDTDQSGSTPLIAAMRCYVASRLGDEVEIPKEIIR